MFFGVYGLDGLESSGVIGCCPPLITLLAASSCSGAISCCGSSPPRGWREAKSLLPSINCCLSGRTFGVGSGDVVAAGGILTYKQYKWWRGVWKEGLVHDIQGLSLSLREKKKWGNFVMSGTVVTAMQPHVPGKLLPFLVLRLPCRWTRLRRLATLVC
jgi:hypothetical protein